MRREVGNRAVGINPLRGRHRAALRDAGHVIHLVTHQRKIVDDSFGPDTVLFLHLLAIENLSSHGVDELNLVVHDLSKILVPRGNEDFPPGGFPGFRKGRQHVVGLHALDLQQRPPLQHHHFQNGFNLASQFVRHRRAIRLVFRENFMTEILSRRVKHAGRVIWCNEGLHIFEHAVKALDGARRFSAARRQRRQRMERTKQVVGTVNEK